MALFILRGSNTSFFTRFYILALIALVLVCFCSYCSSSSIVSPAIDIDQFNNDDEITYDVPSRMYAPERPIMLPNERFFQLLLKSSLNQPDYRHHKQTNKRYASQSFHAMRG